MRDYMVLERGQVVVMPPHSRLTASDEVGFGVELAFASTAIDDTMQVLARHYRARCIGVVMTGKLHDGAEGARAIKRVGGRVIVQDPNDAQAPSMPTAVLATGSVDFAVPLRRVAPTLIALAMAPGAAELFRTPRSAWAT
jgi:two-component system chemotaxis response regulator CheB